MKIISKAIIGLLFAVSFSASFASDVKSIEKKVAALNFQAIKSLGVSLNALRYLIDADPNNYLLFSHLEQSGDIRFIRELETKGYVKTEKVKALPDGTQAHEEFLRIIPLALGKELQRCVVGLKT